MRLLLENRSRQCSSPNEGKCEMLVGLSTYQL